MGHFKVPHFLYVVPCLFSLFATDRPGFPDINIPIYIALYLGYKIFYRSKIPSLKDVDLVTNIPSMEETERPEIPPTTIWGKIGAVLF